MKKLKILKIKCYSLENNYYLLLLHYFNFLKILKFSKTQIKKII